jgi:hypothetical protein
MRTKLLTDNELPMLAMSSTDSVLPIRAKDLKESELPNWT